MDKHIVSINRHTFHQCLFPLVFSDWVFSKSVGNHVSGEKTEIKQNITDAQIVTGG